MARYKDVLYDQDKFIPVAFSKQILTGTFEYTLSYVVDHELDLSVFDERYRNDETGAPAFDPAVLLKIVLYAYSRGITSSRQIERTCRENVIFMALSADTQPHFTTIANFVSTMDKQIVPLIRSVLMICGELQLIGNEMFAIDGCKLPGNASKSWSGTKAELKNKQRKLEKAAGAMLKRHREDDSKPDDDRHQQELKAVKSIRAKAKKIRDWLDDNDDKPGKGKQPRKSNITDNESAKMKTSKGVIQGYDGVECVDAKHQVIVHGEAYGEAQEHDLMQPIINQTREHFAAMGYKDIFRTTTLTADSRFYNTANVTYLYENGIDGYLPDLGFRKRDPRCAGADRHRTRHKKDKMAYEGRKTKRYTSPDFHYDAATHTCICPAGNKLYSNGRSANLGGYEALRFRGAKRDCLPCGQREKCLRNPEKTQTRQVAIFLDRAKTTKPAYLDMMRKKIDTPEGRHQYSRMGIVEPVFGNICSALGLNRFWHRGKKKVDTQWKLYCMVHLLLKIHRYSELGSG